MLDATESERAAERAKVETKGWGCINGRTVADGAYFVRSSFVSTINVLEDLLEYEGSTGRTPASPDARKSS